MPRHFQGPSPSKYLQRLGLLVRLLIDAGFLTELRSATSLDMSIAAKHCSFHVNNSRSSFEHALAGDVATKSGHCPTLRMIVVSLDTFLPPRAANAIALGTLGGGIPRLSLLIFLV